jgi:hypothetical protein
MCDYVGERGIRIRKRITLGSKWKMSVPKEVWRGMRKVRSGRGRMESRGGLRLEARQRRQTKTDDLLHLLHFSLFFRQRPRSPALAVSLTNGKRR